jgi:hypothetical protein
MTSILADGDAVFITGRTASRVADMAAEIGAKPIVGDATSPAQVARMAGDIGDDLDVLVNMAGGNTDFTASATGPEGLLAELERVAAAWHANVDANLLSAVLTTTAGLGKLRPGGANDPLGEVGIEFMVVTDGSDGQAVSYGVLGRRWVYDGISDPVLVGQLVALIHGVGQAQMQSVNDTPDPTVTCVPVAAGAAATIDSAVVGNGPLGTELQVDIVGDDGSRGGRLVVTVNRVMQPDDAGLEHGAGGESQRGRLFAGWRLADGTAVRGCLAAARYSPAH